ncbi:MAG: Fur family transcriptional regulator [Candidatus Limnocylindrales bacterium]
MDDPARFIRALEHAGYHITSPRRAVAELVAARDGRFSAHDLILDAQHSRRDVGRATVFRTLELLESLGLVESLHLPSGEHAYVACKPVHHHHLVCERCGRTVEVGDLGFDPVARDLEARTGYLVDFHRIEIFGLCPACRAEAASAPAATSALPDAPHGPNHPKERPCQNQQPPLLHPARPSA